MGTAVAERLLEADFPLVVYNRTPSKAEPLAARGATVAGSAADLAGETDVVLTSLSDDDALEAVAGDVLAEPRPGTVLVDLSTVSPAASARIASVAEAASVDYLRAPVSGPRDALERVAPVIRAIGPRSCNARRSAGLSRWRRS